MSTQPPIPSTFDQDFDSWAVFGQATWNATNTLRVTGGIRYNEETKDLDKVTGQDELKIRFGPELTFFANPLNGDLVDDLRSHSFTNLSRDEEKWTFSDNLQWDASDNAMLYASVSTGFKGGGYDENYSNEGEIVRKANPATG